jgi:cell shape-determining protein MreD
MKITKKRVIQLIFLFTFLLEGYLSVRVPFIATRPSLFVLPAFTVINIAVFYNFLEEKEMFQITLVAGFLYDFIYIGNVGIYMVTYSLLVLAARYLYLQLGERFLNVLLVSYALILIKEFLLGFIYFVILEKVVTIDVIAYRLVRGLLFNVLYVIFIYFLVNSRFRKFFRK